MQNVKQGATMEGHDSKDSSSEMVRLAKWLFALVGFVGGLAGSLVMFGITVGTYRTEIASAQQATEYKIQELVARTDRIEIDRKVKIEENAANRNEVNARLTRIETKIDLLLKN